jgi:hypothetical protein
MSERSKNLARYIRRAKGHPPDIMQTNYDEVLDKGFFALERGFSTRVS